MNIEMATPLQLEEKLYRLSHDCERAEAAFVKAEECFNMLDDYKKIIFAEITERMDGKTTAEKERKALTSQEWKTWLAGYQAARAEASELKAKRNSFQRFHDTCRSILSSKNRERDRI